MATTDPPDYARLKTWVVEEMSDVIFLTPEDAERIADACCPSPGHAPGNAATVVAIARALRSLPAARDWWEQNGTKAIQWLTEGKIDEVDDWLAEDLAPPAPDLVDFNWPGSKVFNQVPIPVGLSIGDEFLVGDGMGSRAWAKVVLRDGQVGAVLQRRVYTPFREIRWDVWDEATDLFDP